MPRPNATSCQVFRASHCPFRAGLLTPPRRRPEVSPNVSAHAPTAHPRLRRPSVTASGSVRRPATTSPSSSKRRRRYRSDIFRLSLPSVAVRSGLRLNRPAPTVNCD
jgi:hypothetical protein